MQKQLAKCIERIMSGVGVGVGLYGKQN